VRGLARRLVLGWLVGAVRQRRRVAGVVSLGPADRRGGRQRVRRCAGADGSGARRARHGPAPCARAARRAGPAAVALAALVGSRAAAPALPGDGITSGSTPSSARRRRCRRRSSRPGERAARRDAVQALAHGERQLAELRTLQQDVQWGTRALDAERRSGCASSWPGARADGGRSMVLGTLRAKARERQRYWLGLPLLALARAARSRWRAARAERYLPS